MDRYEMPKPLADLKPPADIKVQFKCGQCGTLTAEATRLQAGGPFLCAECVAKAPPDSAERTKVMVGTGAEG